VENIALFIWANVDYLAGIRLIKRLEKVEKVG